MAQVKLDIVIKAIDQASGIFGKIGAAGDEGRRKMEAMGKQAVIAGAAITAAFTGAAIAAAKFNEGMATVATLVDTSTVNMGKLKDGVNDVAVATGKSANDLTTALYDIVSAGIDAADAIDVLDVAARSAVAGNVEASVAVKGITSALNAYNLEASEAEHVSDLFLTAVEKGQTTMEELSSSIGRVAPTAAAMGISLEETLGALSAMTLGGISTRESVSGLKAALANVLKPGAEAEEMAKALGIEFNAAALESKGLVPFLNEVSDAAEGDATKMNQLFGSVEGVNAVLAITGENAGKTADVMDAMGDSAGTTEEKFAIMSDTTAAAFNRIREQFMSLVRTVGDIVIPAFEALMGWLQPVINKFQEIAESPIGGVLVAIGVAAGGLALAVGGVALATLSMQRHMKTAREGMKLLKAVFIGTGTAAKGAGSAAATSGTKAQAASVKWTALANAMKSVAIIAAALKVLGGYESTKEIGQLQAKVDQAKNLEEKLAAEKELFEAFQRAPISGIEKQVLKVSGKDYDKINKRKLENIKRIQEDAEEAGLDLKDVPATASAKFLQIQVKAARRKKDAEAGGGTGSVSATDGSIAGDIEQDMAKLVQQSEQLTESWEDAAATSGDTTVDAATEAAAIAKAAAEEAAATTTGAADKAAGAVVAAGRGAVGVPQQNLGLAAGGVHTQPLTREQRHAANLANQRRKSALVAEEAARTGKKPFEIRQEQREERLADKERLSNISHKFGGTRGLGLAMREAGIPQGAGGGAAGGQVLQDAAGGAAVAAGGAVSARAAGQVGGTVNLNVVSTGSGFEQWLRGFISNLVQEAQIAHGYQGG